MKWKLLIKILRAFIIYLENKSSDKEWYKLVEINTLVCQLENEIKKKEGMN